MSSSTIKQVLTSLASFFRRITGSDETFTLEKMARLTAKLLNYSKLEENSFTTFDGMCKTMSNAIRFFTKKQDPLTLDEMRWELEYIFKDKVAVIVREDYEFFEDLPSAFDVVSLNETIHIINNVDIGTISETNVMNSSGNTRSRLFTSADAVTLDGHGFALSAKCVSPVTCFIMASKCRLTVKNLVVNYDAHSNVGHSVLGCMENGEFEVYNCTFNSTQQGIYSYYHTGTVTIRNSILTTGYRSYYSLGAADVYVENSALSSTTSIALSVNPKNAEAEGIVTIDNSRLSSDANVALRITDSFYELLLKNESCIKSNAEDYADAAVGNYATIYADDSYTGPAMLARNNGSVYFAKGFSDINTEAYGVWHVLRDFEIYSMSQIPTSCTIVGEDHLVTVHSSVETAISVWRGNVEIRNLTLRGDGLTTRLIKVTNSASLTLDAVTIETPYMCLQGYYCSGDIRVLNSTLVGSTAPIQLQHSRSIVDIENTIVNSNGDDSKNCYIFSGNPELNLRTGTIMQGAEIGIFVGNNATRPSSYPKITFYDDASITSLLEEVRFTLNTCDDARELYYDDSYRGVKATRYDSEHEDGTVTTKYSF